MPEKTTHITDLAHLSAQELVDDSFLLQERSLIQEGLEHLDQGISIFDKNLNLVAANSYFLELLGFPSEFGEHGTSLEKLFRYNAERGEYGPGNVDTQVTERLDKALKHEPHCFQRIRPDGLVLEIRGIPVRDFGFVSTYTDITERIQSAEKLRFSQQRFQDMARAASDWFWELDAEHQLTFISDRFYAAVGVPPQEIIGRTRPQIADPQDVIVNADKWKIYEQALQDRIPFRDFEYCFLGAQNRRYYLKVSGVPVFGVDGGFRGYRGTGTDVTALKEAELALEESARHFRAVLDSSQAGVTVTSQKDGQFKYVNPRLAEMFECPTSNLMKNRPQFYYHDRNHWADILIRFDRDGVVKDEEVEFKRENGTTFWALVTLQLTDFENQECILTWYYDVTELRNSRDELARLAQTDPLTGLANRRLFNENVERALARADRLKSNGALIYFDLDGFKAVNDENGHDLGDWLLKQVSLRVQDQLRRSDLLSRLGGDEFTILIEDVKSNEEAMNVSEKILQALTTAFIYEGREFLIGASIGITFFDGSSKDVDALVIEADLAMYKAKKAGRGCIMVHNE